jgi:hypothetical protein
MLLPVGQCSTRLDARSLGITQRTLHRQLAAERQSFSSVVHATREALAERYRTGDRYLLTDVSQLLGLTASERLLAVVPPMLRGEPHGVAGPSHQLAGT